MSSGALKKWNEGHDCRSTVPKTHICQPLPRCDKGRTCAKVDRKERTRQNFTAFFHSAHASTHAIAFSHARTALSFRISTHFSPTNAALAVAFFSAPPEGRLKTRGLSTKSGGVLPKSPQFLLRCSRVFHRTGIVCFQPCATFFDRTWVFRSTSANFCFDRAFILCIFATIYYHHRTRSRKIHQLP